MRCLLRLSETLFIKLVSLRRIIKVSTQAPKPGFQHMGLYKGITVIIRQDRLELRT
jgi:hypothetical protein